MTRSASIPTPGRGFTLIELIAVIVIMSVVVGLAAPRLTRTRSGRLDVTVDRIADLLSIAAHRDALGGRHVAVRHDQETGALSLMVRELGSEDWREDPLTARVELGDLVVDELTVGTGSMSRASREPWWIEFPQGEPRGAISMTLIASDGGRDGREWVIRLASHATAAEVVGPGDVATAGMEPVDLDRAGLEDVAW